MYIMAVCRSQQWMRRGILSEFLIFGGVGRREDDAERGDEGQNKRTKIMIE
jgi:hypothetical protein